MGWNMKMVVGCYLFWKPGTEEGHVERVGVRVDGAEGIGTHGANQSVNPASQLVANFTAKNPPPQKRKTIKIQQTIQSISLRRPAL